MSALSWRRPALAPFCAFASLIFADTFAADVVGRAAGHASVGPTGAAQYSIPLWTPPGTNGLQPSLALVYSSSSGNGLLGMGWSIAGLSSITRCSQTPAQDTAWNAASLSSTDKLCLDGSRLRLVTGTQGAAGSTYRTEIETFSLVTANGTQGNGPAWFEVKTKDGLVYEYGNSSSSFIEALASGGGQVSSARAWALSRIKDRNHNYVEFFYTEDTTNGGYRPHEIHWTGNSLTGTLPQYKVAFVYEGVARPDTIWGYRFGDGSGVDGKQNETKRLDRIDICQGTTTPCALVVRSYDVAYEVSGGAGNRSRIDSIQEKGAGTDTFPATNLDWINGNAGWDASETNTSQSIPSGVTPMIMDISGDGRDDVIWSTSATSGSGFWAYMLANASGGFDAIAITTIPNTGFAQALPIQWDGDDKWDILVPYGGGTWWVLRATGNAAPGGLVLHADSLASSTGMFWVADIDGDGRGDLLRGSNTAGANGYCEIRIRLRGPSGFNTEVLAYTCSPRVKLNGTTPFGLLEYKWRRPDFNADGREDVVIALIENDPETIPNPTYLDLLTSSDAGLGTSPSLGWFYQTQTGVNGSSHWRYGDLNGDGLTDMVVRSNAGSLRFAFSRGEAMASWVSTSLGIDSTSLLTDWDSDELDDFVSAAGSPVNWNYARSTGAGFAAVVNSGLAASTTPVAATGDFSGDGLHDLIRADGTIKHRAHLGVQPDLLDRATDGFGAYVDFNYGAMVSGSCFARDSALPAYPDRALAGRNWLACSFTASNGIGGTYQTSFSYYNANLNQHGRGFLGFERRYFIDDRNSIVNMETYRHDFPYIGTTAYVLQRQSDWSTKIREETYTLANIAYPPAPPAESRWFPYVDRQEIRNYEVNVGGTANGAHVSTITTDVASIDSWGTVTDVTTTTTEVSTGGSQNSTQTQRVYHPLVLNDFSSANWCLSRPRQTQLTNAHSLNGGTSITRSIDHEWDASKCRMTQEVIEPASATLKVTTDLLYETSYGNLERSTVTPVGLSPRATQLSWAPNGQFLQSVTNPLSQVTTYAWYADRGLLLRITDPNTLQTTFEYDAFARLSKEIRPDGTATQTEYMSCSGEPDCTGFSNVEYKVQSTLKNNGSSTVIAQSFVVLDDFGRVRRATRFQLEGGKSDVLTEYAAAGWVQRMTQPHFTGDTAALVWTDYTHDILGRVTQESRPKANDDVLSAHTVTHVFEGLAQKTTDAAGKLTTRTLSAWGDVLRVTDHDGKAVAYEYDAFTDLKKTTDPAGHQTTMSYNVRGWKISSSDPDMGAWTYDYFPTGELKSQTDANSRTVTFGIPDLLGRPTTRSELEGTTTWTWGSTAAAWNLGQLQMVSSPGWEESYTFDSAGRPATTTTTIDGVGHTFTNTYNATTGFPETLQYPASFSTAFKLQYQYETANKSGLLKKVSDFNAGTVFWEATSTNAFSQYGDLTLGGAAGARTVSTFDLVTGAVNHTLTTDGGTVVQDFDYERDTVGNLKKRVDVRQSSLTETFGYDNLHRLTSATLSTGPLQTFTYDANGLGNLLTKTGTGSYSYTAIVGGCTYHAHAQPHAVREIIGAITQTFCYDANGNVTKRNGATVSWYSYNLPQTINQADGMYATFSYDANRQRYKQVALAYDAPGSVQRTTVHVGDVFDKVTESGATTFKHYVRANGDLIAVQLRTSSSTLNRYLYEDHLQSTEGFAGDDGAAFGRFSFDAWGKRRDRDWDGPISAADRLLAWQNTNRAFTSHEQLDNLGLVHMNGRVYDPGIGRFISADPFVADAFNLQALNRYSYVLNNPLSLFDPSGFTPEDPFPPIDPGPGDHPGPGDDCAYDIFCGPPGGGPRFPGNLPPLFAPPPLGDPLYDFCTSGIAFCFGGPTVGLAWEAITRSAWWNTGHRTTLCGPACAKAGFPPRQVTITNGELVLNAINVTTLVAPMVAPLLTPEAVAVGVAENLAARGLNITERGLAHALARHAVGGAPTAGKSVFNAGEDIAALVRNAGGVQRVQQTGGNFERVIDAGRTIGIDRATGQPTSIYTVITNAADDLITAFPGRP